MSAKQDLLRRFQEGTSEVVGLLLMMQDDPGTPSPLIEKLEASLRTRVRNSRDDYSGQFVMRNTPDIKEKIDALTSKYECTASDLVRSLVNFAAEALLPAASHDGDK